MSDIVANISNLRSQIPESVKLVAVSKTKTVGQILEAYNTGQKCFGENKVQEIMLKKDLLPSDIEWHLIGHLQSNKVRFIVPFISLIHSVDSFKLLKSINSEASDIKKVIDCLLQIHIAREDTKFGFSMKEIEDMILSPEFSHLDNIRICGVMGMATFTSDIKQIQKEFKYLTGCFNSIKQLFFSSKPFFKEISMGMSGDFKIALNEGSTILRIGSLIFGER
jgi:hypothetical protein